MPERHHLDYNAARICDAISRIGYSADSAILDIVDNSVSASASQIEINLQIQPGKYLQKAKNIKAISICDNGSGMDEQELKKCFELGPEPENGYPSGSLSKFGMGLKSAGLNLGDKITVISKKSEGEISAYCLDVGVIRETQQWTIEKKAKEDGLESFFEKLNQKVSGTCVYIENCSKINQSAKTTIRRITTRAGVIYEGFLNNGLTLGISYDEQPLENIPALDMMFKDEQKSFDPENIDCKQPYRVVSEKIDLPTPEAADLGPVLLEIAIFPQDRMKTYGGFTKEEKDRIKEYQISENNNGFFIYRNGRLIRWAEYPIAGISRLRGFRARLDLTEKHDDYFHVDVSKQHLTISEEIEEILEKNSKNALRMHKQVFEKCEELYHADGVPEGESSSDRLDEIDTSDVEESLIEGEGLSDEEIAERRRKLEEKSLETETEETKNIEDGSEEADDSTNEGEKEDDKKFRKVRYSETIRGHVMWDAQTDPHEGPYVRINKNHEFYQSVLAKLPATDPSRISIESLLWCLAVGELKVLQTSTLELEVVEALLRDFKRVISVTSDKICTKSYDLFD